MKYKLTTYKVIISLMVIFLFLKYDRFINTFDTLFSHSLAKSLFNVGVIYSVAFMIIFMLTIIFRKSKILNVRIGWAEFCLILLLFVLAFAPLVANFDYDFRLKVENSRLLPPLSSVELSQKSNTADPIKYSEENESKVYHLLFGTDELRRDIFSRIVYGIRRSLLIALGSVFVSLIISVGLVLIGSNNLINIDPLINSFVDFIYCIPGLFVIVILLSLFGSSDLIILLVLGYSGSLPLYKILRTEILKLKEMDYYKISLLLGKSRWNILGSEMIPFVISPIIVSVIFHFASVIFAETALSYLGLSGDFNTPSLGQMIHSGQAYLTKAWWVSIIPGVFVILIIFTANYFSKVLKLKLNPLSESG